MDDIHSQIAREVFGIVTPDTRRRAKTISFLDTYLAGDIKVGQVSGRYPNSITARTVWYKDGTQKTERL